MTRRHTVYLADGGLYHPSTVVPHAWGLELTFDNRVDIEGRPLPPMRQTFPWRRVNLWNDESTP